MNNTDKTMIYKLMVKIKRLDREMKGKGAR